MEILELLKGKYRELEIRESEGEEKNIIVEDNKEGIRVYYKINETTTLSEIDKEIKKIFSKRIKEAARNKEISNKLRNIMYELLDIGKELINESVNDKENSEFLYYLEEIEDLSKIIRY